MKAYSKTGANKSHPTPLCPPVSPRTSGLLGSAFPYVSGPIVTEVVRPAGAASWTSTYAPAERLASLARLLFGVLARGVAFSPGAC